MPIIVLGSDLSELFIADQICKEKYAPVRAFTPAAVVSLHHLVSFTAEY